MRPFYLFFMLLCSASAAASDLPPEDQAMLTACRNELTERLFEGKAHGETFVSNRSIERQGERVAVRLELASGEGRSLSGTCIFRNGKLFDVK